MLDSIERVRLAHLPTPLQPAPRLGRALGLERLWLKRDDLTGIGASGNKSRKLEYEFAEVQRQRSDVVLTVGGPQSNHARITAALARKQGLDVKLVLGGEAGGPTQGNLLLDSLFGAEIRRCADDTNEALQSTMENWAEELRKAGRRPYCIPLGGSTPLGALGYVNAMRELAGQMDPEPTQIVLAVGSCGSLAGVCLGAELYLPQARVVGISVSRSAASIAERTAGIAVQSAALISAKTRLNASNIEVHDGYYEAYAKFTPAAKSAIELCARTEGILLDPVYTGKAMAGLIDLVRLGVLNPRQQTVFIHTGGMPILFAYEKQLLGLD